MKIATGKLIDQTELLMGEELIAEFEGRQLDGQGNDLEHTTLSLTQWRLGVWHKKGTSRWIPLSAIKFATTETDRINFVFSNDNSLTVRTEDTRKLEAFANAIFDKRRAFLLDSTHAAFEKVYDLLREGDLALALSSVQEITREEMFHPGPSLLEYVLLRALGKGREAASGLAAITFQGLSTLPMSTAILVTSAALNPAQAYKVAVSAAIGMPCDEQGPWQLLVTAHYATVRGMYDYAVTAISYAALHLAGFPLVALSLLREQASLLPRSQWARLAGVMDYLAPEFARNIAESGLDLDVATLQRLWNLALDAGLDALSRVHAFIECIELLGGSVQDYPGLLCAIGRWDSLSQQNGFELPEEKDWKGAIWDSQAFDVLLVNCTERFNGGYLVQRLWANIRLRQSPVYFEAVETAINLHRTMLAGYNGSKPEVWLSALMAAEMLLKVGRGTEAVELIETAYEAVRAEIVFSSDPYHEQARPLKNLFGALGRRDAPRVRLFAERLGTNDAFSWVRGLVLDLYPEALHPEAPPAAYVSEEVAKFQRWLASNSGVLTDRKITDAARKIETAQRREILTVVVGGETSAGKSSFINRLLGADLLFTTQEEATAVPTHVRWGPVLTVTVLGEADKVRDQLRIPPDKAQQAPMVEQFVQRYTFLSSEHSAGTKRVVIETPAAIFLRGMEIVDTPGLNAHASRTAHAQEVIDDAHVCIFVIDARNALKAGEMNKIQWAASAVGKTLFVLNKMDLVLGDDDLDCDLNAPEEVLSRVRRELTLALGTESVNVHAVSSAPTENVPTKAIHYAEALKDVRLRLEELLLHSKERLIAYAAAKAARIASSAAAVNALEQMALHEIEVSRLLMQVPGDPTQFREEVLRLVQSTWHSATDAYTNAMIEALNKAWKDADGLIISNLENCSNHDDVKRFIEKKVPSIYRNYLQAIDGSRSEQWHRVGCLLLEKVADLFRSLYEGLPFKYRFDSSRLLSVATPLPISRSQELKGTVAGMLDAANLKEVGGVAAGAALGTMILPGIGTAIGAWLGGVFGNTLNEDLLQRIYTAVGERLQELRDGAIRALDADITPTESGHAPIMESILENVEAERAQFETVITSRMRETKRELNDAEKRSESNEAVALEASEWARRFESLTSIRAVIATPGANLETR
jgi:GTP-binding protein EngB required for normal cell division